ncbi:MAG: ABC transporter permease [Anaerolineaceae bacterium]|nr:ABC transporter permease [Anaerolineaceae bacterium]
MLVRFIDALDPRQPRPRLRVALPYGVHRLLHDPGALLGLVLVSLVLLTALFADQLAPYGPTEGSLLDAKRPEAWQEQGLPGHVLGTDQLGQDILSRVIYGARVSLAVGFFGVLLASAIGVTLGMSAGYLGGRVDEAITAVVNLLLSFPYLVLVIIVATVFGRNLLNVIIIFGVTDAPVFARLVRGEVLRLRNVDFVVAAVGLGVPTWRILLRHLLPNLVGPLLTLMTFEMSAMIFYEAGLSFLGLSVPPEVPSWGNMLALGRKFLYIFPWMSIYPGLAISLTAFGVNLLGDWLRDVLDPRLRRAD